MKNILYIIVVMLPVLSLGQTTSQNYVKTLTYKEESFTSNASKAQVQVNYFDGIGRPIQIVTSGAGGNGEDIVVPVEYDPFGRQVREYLPVAITPSGNVIAPYYGGLLNPSNGSSPSSFYNTTKYEGTLNPYSQKLVEASPLGRVFEQAAPGNDWKLNMSTLSLNKQLLKCDIISALTCGSLGNHAFGMSHIKIQGTTLILTLQYFGLGDLTNHQLNMSPIPLPVSLPDMEIGELVTGDLGNILGSPTGYKAVIENNALRFKPVVPGVFPQLSTFNTVISVDLTRFLSNGHTIRFDYQTNSSMEVRRFGVTFKVGNTDAPQLSVLGYYDEGQLYKTVTKDENWSPVDGLNKTTEEFKDKNDRIILKRTYNNNLPHDTYYVYDNFANLTYVIPPLASDGIVQVTNNFAGTGQNFPWTSLALVDAQLAADYGVELEAYQNSEILNASLISEYGGQGGFSVVPSANGELTLTINIATTQPMPYRTGQIVDLQPYLGDFSHGIMSYELGRIKGSGYEYIFTVTNNHLVVTGQGNVPSLNVALTGETPLEYTRNYPWTDVADVDPAVKTAYETATAALDNSQIITTYTANSYGAMGGVVVTVDAEDTVTLNLSINSTTAMALKTGATFALDMQRRVADRVLGTVNGYTFSIVDNTLTIASTTNNMFTSLTFNASVANNPTFSVQQTVLEGLCYQYRYDYRNRLVEKKIPGKGWEYIVYDKLDRPVLTQDALMRSRTQAGDYQWLFTKYDEYGRVIYTGRYQDLRGRTALQADVNGNVLQWEHKTTDDLLMVNDGGIWIEYTHLNFPGDNAKMSINIVNFYDNYNFNVPGQIVIPTATDYVTLAANVTGLPTGTKVRCLGISSWITSVSGYDDKGRVVYSNTYDNLLKYYDRVQHQLDFVGKPLQSKLSHTKRTIPNGVITWTTTTILDKFTYDNGQRLLKQVQKINSQPEELIVWNQYDELGQLVQKKVGGANTTGLTYATAGLQTIDMAYNVRGWLKSINDVHQTLTDDLFAFQLNYNSKVLTQSTPLYNGNIAETHWRSRTDNNRRSYSYAYDALNRLQSSNYVGNYALVANPGQIENYQEGPITYDKNGNILSLQRYGLTATNTIDIIDQLVYSYDANSNTLRNVLDTAGTTGFKDGNIATGSTPDYEYDVNGNIRRDRNKGYNMAVTDYDFHNLPNRIRFGTTGTIYINNDAAGVRQKKSVQQGSTTYVTEYNGMFIYMGLSTAQPELQHFQQPEGYVQRESNGSFSYIYQYKDHLGNIRMSYKQAANGLEVIEEDNYYAFGLKHAGYNAIVSSNGNSQAQKYKYNGKELQEDLNLNLYDYGARHYDAAIGKWMSIDPLAETSRRWTPYNYCYNNPLYFIDPDGMEAEGLESSDIDEMVNIGYGRTVERRKISGAVSSLTQNEVSLTKKGKTKLDRQLNAAFPVSSAFPEGADSRAPASIETVHELIDKVPILKDIYKLLKGKFDMITNSNFQHSSGADAITDPRRNGSDPEPLGRPLVIFYGASFSEGYRELGHTVLHEFGHVYSIVTRNFFKNYLTEKGNWNRAVYLDEDYAYRFAYKHGGRKPEYYSGFKLAWDKYYSSKRAQVKRE
jgi:RHS repeat-associated protein